MKYIILIAKTYAHRGKHNHKPSTKKHWRIYYYDEDGKFHQKQVNFIQAMYYKTQKLRRLKYICTECGYYFVGLVKSPKQKLDCPNCEA